MTKNLRAKTVDRANAYEVRVGTWSGEFYYALKYYQADNRRPEARVKVAHGDDLVGHDMYVQQFEQLTLTNNPLVSLPEPKSKPVQLSFTEYIHVICCLDR